MCMCNLLFVSNTPCGDDNSLQSKRKADDEPEPEPEVAEVGPGAGTGPAADVGAGDEDMGVTAAADSEGPAGAGAAAAGGAAPATDSVAFGLAAGEAELEMPWVEKYRPRVLADVIGNEEAVKRLAVIAEEGNMPNLILSVRGVFIFRSTHDVPSMCRWWGQCVVSTGLAAGDPPELESPSLIFARAKLVGVLRGEYIPTARQPSRSRSPDTTFQRLHLLRAANVVCVCGSGSAWNGQDDQCVVLGPRFVGPSVPGRRVGA